MKRIVLTSIFLAAFSAVSGYSLDPSLSTGLGMDFFFSRTYGAEAFLSTSATLGIPAGRDMEFCLGAEFALWPREGEDPLVVKPAFLIPVDVGVQFVFSRITPHIVFGMGVTPVFLILPDADPLLGEEVLRFYAGPYVNFGIRLPVHEIMSWFVDLQQDLAIGKPDWINTTTRVITGINFRIASNAEDKKTAAVKSKTAKK